MKHINQGFTLIELLIVVAIIGILAAIAVPNFLNAQIKARVARVQSDIKAIATAQEMYYLDNNTYPPESENNIFTGRRARAESGLFFLTSPIAYMSSVPHDPFQDKIDIEEEAAYETGVAKRFTSGNISKSPNIAYVIFSQGPDLTENGLFSAQPFTGPQHNGGNGNSYNTTNGIKSNGDIFWYGGNPSVTRALRVDGRVYNGGFPPNFAN